MGTRNCCLPETIDRDAQLSQTEEHFGQRHLFEIARAMVVPPTPARHRRVSNVRIMGRAHSWIRTSDVGPNRFDRTPGKDWAPETHAYVGLPASERQRGPRLRPGNTAHPTPVATPVLLWHSHSANDSKSSVSPVDELTPGVAAFSQEGAESYCEKNTSACRPRFGSSV